MWLNKSLALVSLVAMSAMAQEQLYVYPKNGQSNDQQEKDEYACYVNTKRKTHIDPITLARPAESRVVREKVGENEHEGGARRGQAIGTVAGAVIGHNNHHAVGGMIIGSVLGGLIGESIEASGRKEQRKIARANAKEKAMEQAAARAEYNEKLGIFNEAFIRCLNDRGYVVK